MATHGVRLGMPRCLRQIKQTADPKLISSVLFVLWFTNGGQATSNHIEHIK